MAKPATRQTKRRTAQKHRLRIYQRAARRYRAPAIILIWSGLVIAVLGATGVTGRLLNPSALATVGVAETLVGVVLLILAVLTVRSYVQCGKTLIIQGPTNRVSVGYGQIESLSPVPVDDLFPRDAQQGAQAFMLDGLYDETAVLVEVSDYPLEIRRLTRFFSPYLLSPRGTGYVLVVSEPSRFMRELDAYVRRWRAAQRKRGQASEDPIARAPAINRSDVDHPEVRAFEPIGR